MTRTKVEEAVHVDDGPDVLVRRERDSERIQVRFQDSCGEREFTPEKLKECIYYIDELGYDSWILLRDSNNSEFYVHVESNELSMVEWMNSDEVRKVPWEHLLESLEEAIG